MTAHATFLKAKVKIADPHAAAGSWYAVQSGGCNQIDRMVLLGCCVQRTTSFGGLCIGCQLLQHRVSRGTGAVTVKWLPDISPEAGGVWHSQGIRRSSEHRSALPTHIRMGCSRALEALRVLKQRGQGVAAVLRQSSSRQLAISGQEGDDRRARGLPRGPSSVCAVSLRAAPSTPTAPPAVCS